MRVERALVPTFIAVDRVLLNYHGSSIHSSQLFCLSPTITDICLVFSSSGSGRGRNTQDMASKKFFRSNQIRIVEVRFSIAGPD